MKSVLSVVAIVLSGVLLIGVADASGSALSGGHLRTPPVGCSPSHRCHLVKGTYRLGSGTVLPGLRFTLPSGWSSGENDKGEFNLVPPGHPHATLFVWMDLLAVKSTGPGHGTTVLTNVGTTPTALVRWLTRNHALHVVSRPSPSKIAGRIPATTLTIGVSRSAHYGDPHCPANPRCADLFTSGLWSDSYGIGGAEQAQLSLAKIKQNGSQHTMFITLDAGTGSNHRGLITLRKLVRSIVASFRLPKSVTTG